MGGASTNRLVIRGGTLIDGTGRAPVPNEAIVIEGNTIKQVGPYAGIAPMSTRTIDANGRFIMPGLIDGHCHISLHQGGVRGVRFPSGAEAATLWAAYISGRILRAGVTSISVPGGRWFVDVTVRNAVDAGLIEGPRIFCAARALTPYGGIFDGGPSWQEPPKDTAAVLCNTVEEYVTEVRRQAKHGVNLIKIADSNRGETQTVNLAEMQAVADEAHRRGVKVAIHARGSGSIRDAALAGLDWIFHADLATESDLDVIAKAGVPLMPVFTSVFLEIERGRELSYPAPYLDMLQRQLDINISAIRAAHARGITVLSGSDTGNIPTWPHGRYHGREAGILVKHIGLSPMQAIESCTRLNARVMGLEGRLGTIEADKLADIIILDADPLANVDVLREPKHIVGVIKDGAVVDLGEPPRWGTLPYEPQPAATLPYWIS